MMWPIEEAALLLIEAEASTVAARRLRAAEGSMAGVPFMQGEAVCMSAAAVIMPPATMNPDIMRADITEAAPFMGGGALTSVAERFMAGEPSSQAAEALLEGVTLRALVVLVV